MDRELKKRSKKVQKLTKDGMVERNMSTGDERRISSREQNFDLRGSEAVPEHTLRQAQQTDQAEQQPKHSVRGETAEGTGHSRSGRTQHLPQPSQDTRQNTAEHTAQHTANALRDNSGGIHAKLPEYTQSAKQQLQSTVRQPQSSESPAHHTPGDSDFPVENRTEPAHPSTSSIRHRSARSTAPDSSSRQRSAGRSLSSAGHRHGSAAPDASQSNVKLNQRGTAYSQQFTKDLLPHDTRQPKTGEDSAPTAQAPSTKQKTAPPERSGQLRFERSDSTAAALSGTKSKQGGTAYRRKFSEDKPPPAGNAVSHDATPANNTSDTTVKLSSSDQQNSAETRYSAETSRLADTDHPADSASSADFNSSADTSSTADNSSADTPPTADDSALTRRPKDSKVSEGKMSDNNSAAAKLPPEPPPKKSKLEFSKDEQPSDQPKKPPNSSDKPKPSRKVEKTRRKAEKSAEKLEKAKEKLPAKKKARLQKVLDEKSGEMKRKLHFETVTKTQREHLKGPLITRPVKAAAGAAIHHAHRKIYQVEDENVAVKAAHRGERTVESGLRTAYRRHKTKTYRRVEKLQKRAAKRAINHACQKALHDNPKLRSNVFSRMMQKRKIKKEYAKAARGAGRGGFALAKKTAFAAGRAVKHVVMAVARHPAVLGVIALILLILFMVAGFFVSCANMAAGGLSTIVASSYLAEDADIDDAGIAYSEWETDLRLEIENAETTHSGYDEYRYDIGDIGHDPFELMAFLTAVYQDFTMSEIEAIMREIFDEQYSLTFTPEVEIRTRTETRTGIGTNPDGSTYSYEYTVEVQYEWHILNVSLVTKPFSEIIADRMNDDQREIFDVLMETKGNRQYLISPFAFNWLPNISSHYGWRIHPINGGREFHTGVDIAVPTGTEILAGHDGRVTFAGSNGGYGLFVVIEGDNGLTSRYAHCSAILVSVGQEVKRGDVIAKVGSTGASTGPHLHLEVIMNGRFLNPLFFTSLE